MSNPNANVGKWTTHVSAKRRLQHIQTSNTTAIYRDYSQMTEGKKNSDFEYRGIKIRQFILKYIIMELEKNKENDFDSTISTLGTQAFREFIIEKVLEEVSAFDNDDKNKRKINPSKENITNSINMLYTRCLIGVVLRHDIKRLGNEYTDTQITQMLSNQTFKPYKKIIDEIIQHVCDVLFKEDPRIDQKANNRNRGRFKRITKEEMSEIVKCLSDMDQSCKIVQADKVSSEQDDDENR